ncbi:MAG: hypothetical protein CL847_05370 [Crocinitomicaceae bacterium]|nr:hypothetical protein [Crocinitomicaceae bacterium]|tara:strand:+ start:397 stop:816 length:420 start_codon:yes stop_codon:yes gene_type:complete
MKYIPEIRFADIDSYGIVHNAKYLIFFEQSRINMFHKIVGNWDWEKRGVLVANQKIDYIHPVRLNDKLEITTWIKSIGDKSLTISYEAHIINDSNKTLSAKSETVIVCFDPSTKLSVIVPKRWRESIEKHGFLNKPSTC